MSAPWFFLLACLLTAPAAAALYKHVDEAGNVTYSDRPQNPDQAALRLPPPNVATPEARRQLEIARQASEREEQAEVEARVRRWAAAQRGAPASLARLAPPAGLRYASSDYYPYYYPSYSSLPSFNSLITGTNAGSPGQGHPPQGLHPPGLHHRAHHARH